MDVEQRCDPYKQPPPRPVLHAEELAHIALDTAHCQLLNLSQTQQIQYWQQKKYQTKFKERTFVCLDIVHVIRRLMNKMNKTYGFVLDLLTFFPNKSYFSEDILEGRTIVFYVFENSEHGRSLLTFRLTILWLSSLTVTFHLIISQHFHIKNIFLLCLTVYKTPKQQKPFKMFTFVFCQVKELNICNSTH